MELKYDENTHLLTLYLGDAQVQYTITKLTENVIFIESKHIDDGKQCVTIAEYRIV